MKNDNSAITVVLFFVGLVIFSGAMSMIFNG